MVDVTVELNYEGVRELLRSSEMAEICKELADGIAAQCGEGYEVTVYTGANRVNASVAAVTKEAIEDNYENNTLLRAVGAG